MLRASSAASGVTFSRLAQSVFGAAAVVDDAVAAVSVDGNCNCNATVAGSVDGARAFFVGGGGVTSKSCFGFGLNAGISGISE